MTNLYNVTVYNDDHEPSQVGAEGGDDEHAGTYGTKLFKLSAGRVEAATKEEARDFGRKLGEMVWGHYHGSEMSVHVEWTGKL